MYESVVSLRVPSINSKNTNRGVTQTIFKQHILNLHRFRSFDMLSLQLSFAFNFDGTINDFITGHRFQSFDTEYHYL